MPTPQLLNSVFNAGEQMGEYLAYTFCLLMAVELAYVFVKYVITTDR